MRRVEFAERTRHGSPADALLSVSCYGCVLIIFDLPFRAPFLRARANNRKVERRSWKTGGSRRAVTIDELLERLNARPYLPATRMVTARILEDWATNA
jgi:hypothetical protein